MLTKILVFGLVALLTRSPLVAALVTLAVWVVLDWNAFRLLPRLGRRLWDLRLAADLSRTLAQNPHDRRARAALAEVWLRLHRPAAAIEVVRPAVEADPGDREALFQLGVACLRRGDRERGELFLREVEAMQPDFRQGEIPFEIARARLRAGDAAGTLDAVQRFLAAHPASVRGLVLLGLSQARRGDGAAARAAYERAWDEFGQLPRFARREARIWAWRARPSRPLLLLGLALFAVALLLEGPRWFS